MQREKGDKERYRERRGRKRDTKRERRGKRVKTGYISSEGWTGAHTSRAKAGDKDSSREEEEEERRAKREIETLVVATKEM